MKIHSVIKSSKSSYSGLNSRENLKLLEGLTLDMLEQTWDNYPESDENEAYEIVLDHVILVINEMDDGDEPMYSSLVPFADYDDKEFCDKVREFVSDHYDEYEWWDY